MPDSLFEDDFCAMRHRVKLIANPIAGGDARTAIAQAVTFLEARGARVALVLTARRGDAENAARAARGVDFDLVIAAGGDGTLNEVANGLAGTGLPLAFVPLGTANVMALEMGLPPGIAAACRVALDGESRRVALAEVNGRYFLMMAGIGFDAAAVRAVSSPLKRKFGKLAYVVAGVQAWLLNRPVALQLQTEAGELVPVWHLVISNIRYYGGRFQLAPQNGLEKPLLTACLVDQPGRMALLLFWLRIALRGHLLGPVRRIDAREFSLYGASVPVQVDGDASGETPAEQWLKISCHAQRLSLIFPP